jgi:hypothetical protein
MPKPRAKAAATRIKIRLAIAEPVFSATELTASPLSTPEEASSEIRDDLIAARE